MKVTDPVFCPRHAGRQTETALKVVMARAPRGAPRSAFTLPAAATVIADTKIIFLEDSGAPGVVVAPSQNLDVDLLALLPVGLCEEAVAFEVLVPATPLTLAAVLELCDLFALDSSAEGDRVVRGPFFELTAPHTTDLALHYALHNAFEPGFAMCRLAAPRGFHPSGLSVGGQAIFFEPNAGGNSVASEVLAFEALRCLLGADLRRTEMQIAYWSWFSKKTDFSVSIAEVSYGVSVARCFDWRAKGAAGGVSREEAERMLVKKLDGVNKCNVEVCAQDRWAKQFLFLWVRSDADAQMLHDVYVNSDGVAAVRGNTVVLVCVCDDEFVYSNQCVHPPVECTDMDCDIPCVFFDSSVFPFHSVPVY